MEESKGKCVVGYCVNPERMARIAQLEQALALRGEPVAFTVNKTAGGPVLMLGKFEVRQWLGCNYDSAAEILCAQINASLYAAPISGEREQIGNRGGHIGDFMDYAADEIGIDRFSAAMRAKMEKKRGEGRRGWNEWDECTVDMLWSMLSEHIAKRDPVDIGNFAMMIWNRENPTASAPAVSGERVREACAKECDNIAGIAKMLGDETAQESAEACAIQIRALPLAAQPDPGERVREALEPDDIALITKHRLFVEPERDFWWVYQDAESPEWYAGKSIKHAVAAFVAAIPLAAQPEGKQK